MSYQKDFMTLAAELAAERHISKGEAIKQLAHERPELHKQYLAGLKPIRRKNDKNE